MIVTCPQCQTRFSLPTERLGEAGAKVRCSTCHEVWHQMPEQEPVEEETANQIEESLEEEVAAQSEEEDVAPDEDVAVEEEDFETVLSALSNHVEMIDETIPKSVLPTPEDHDVELFPAAPQRKPVENGGDEKWKWNSRASLLGYAAGALVFVLVLLVLLFARSPILKTWPSLHGFYRLIGVQTVMAGEGLVFDRVSAKIQRNETGQLELTGEGYIINLKAVEVAVPIIGVTLKNEAGAVVNTWKMTPPQKYMAPYANAMFHVKHAAPDGAQTIDVRFTLEE